MLFDKNINNPLTLFMFLGLWSQELNFINKTPQKLDIISNKLLNFKKKCVCDIIISDSLTDFPQSKSNNKVKQLYIFKANDIIIEKIQLTNKTIYKAHLTHKHNLSLLWNFTKINKIIFDTGTKSLYIINSIPANIHQVMVDKISKKEFIELVSKKKIDILANKSKIVLTNYKDLISNCNNTLFIEFILELLQIDDFRSLNIINVLVMLVFFGVTDLVFLEKLITKNLNKDALLLDLSKVHHDYLSQFISNKPKLIKYFIFTNKKLISKTKFTDVWKDMLIKEFIVLSHRYIFLNEYKIIPPFSLPNYIEILLTIKKKCHIYQKNAIDIDIKCIKCGYNSILSIIDDKKYDMCLYCYRKGLYKETNIDNRLKIVDYEKKLKLYGFSNQEIFNHRQVNGYLQT